MKTIRLILILLMTLLWACGDGGTDTGNPTTGADDEGDSEDSGDTGDDSQPVSDSQPLVATAILSSLCDKLTSCHESLSSEDCEVGILAVTGLEDAFGLSANSIGPFAEIATAENAGDITANTTEAAQCETDIAALNCSNAAVTSAYRTADPDNFEDIENMIPEGESSCEGVY
ncbi:MAG: hypothetical protein Q7T11_03995 [Deltaproteobacteria bacterium]|nr:hypothetical protein [Deltaproteobacteria bacterium]